MTRAGLAARHPHADKADALRLHRGLAPLRVAKERIATVDHHVAARKQRHQLREHLVHRLAGLHHQEDAARRHERGRELLERPRTDPLPGRAVPFDERMHLPLGASPERNGIAVILDIEREVLAHDRKTDDAYLRQLRRHRRHRFHPKSGPATI